MTKAMALDYISENIRVNCVNPGTTLTPSLEDRINAFDDPVAAKQQFIERQPMGRLGTPGEIAAAILHLARHGGRNAEVRDRALDGRNEGKR